MGEAAPRCLACGAHSSEFWAYAWDAEYRTTDERFTFRKCLACAVLFIDPVPRDRLHEIYPPNYYSFGTAMGSSLTERVKARLDIRLFRRILAEIPGRTLHALDVGGGWGWELNLVRSADPRVASTQVVDFDDRAGEIAERNGHRYFCGRIEDFETDRRFDFVLLLNLIEHVEDPVTILKKVRSLLSPDGRVLIKTPNYESLDATVFRKLNWGGYHCPRHWVLFTRRSLTRAAERAGLGLVDFRYTQGAPFWTISVLSWLSERRAITITQERPAFRHPLYAPLTALFAAFDFARAPLGKLSQMFVVLRAATVAGE